MLTPTTEMNSEIRIMSSASINVESNNENGSDVILVNSSNSNIDSFTTLPLDFDSSNSSIGTMESMNDVIKMESSIPMLTDIAEETVYETELFDETLKLDGNLIESKFLDENSCTEEDSDVSNILIDTCVLETQENIGDNESSQDSVNDTCTEGKEITSELTVNDVDSTENKFTISDNNGEIFVPVSYSSSSTSEMTNVITVSNKSDVNNLITVANNTSEVSNLITISNNTNLISGVLENASIKDVPADNVGDVNFEIISKSVPNVVQVNSLNNKKVTTFKPIAIHNATKFVPISIAPANLNKRPAAVSVGQQGSNVVTKVLVSQGKMGQPFLIANAPSNKQKPICVLPNSSSGSSPVKSITAAQAMQMGIKLQPLRPSTLKPFKQKLILSNVHPGTQVLQKVHQISKPSTPTKILPAPLVSKSSASGQTQKIILRPDYVMKAGSIISKQSTPGQMITISNLQSASVVSNHVSPKKQVQYIKLINNVGSTNMPTVTTAKGKLAAVTPVSTVTNIDKDVPIIVASSNFSSAGLNVNTNNVVSVSKPVSTTGVAVLPTVTTSTTKSTPGQRLILPAVPKSKSDTTVQSLFSDIKPGKTSGNIVVLAEDVLEQFQIKRDLLSTPVKLKEDSKTADAGKISQDNQENVLDSRGATKSPSKHMPTSTFESGNGLKSRKPCNCTRSQCLKLYCECFANGEFCNNCNCVSCHNNISHEENRQNAIRSCLDRNPQAFRPKIGKCLVGLSDRRHTKGCHCKRSGCLKNYCECYEAQIPCSDNCKCIGCKNIDDMLFATTCSGSNDYDKSDQQFEFQTFSKNKLTAEINDAVGQSGSVNPRHAFSFIKDQVVEATCQCLLAQAEDVKRRNISSEDGKKYILEEFGRCLIQIIECAPDKYVPS